LLIKVTASAGIKGADKPGRRAGVFTSTDAADQSDHFSCLVANLQQLLRVGTYRNIFKS